MSYVGTLDQPEPLGKPLVVSVAFHACVVGALLAGSLIHGSSRPVWGDLESAGGVVGVNPVSKIPMVARTGAVNPVANDTDTQAPQAPSQPKPVQKAKEPEPDAIPIKSRTAPPKKLSNVTASNSRYRPYTQPKPNQLYSTAGGALVSPAMGMAGSGGVGLGRGSPFGNQVRSLCLAVTAVGRAKVEYAGCGRPRSHGAGRGGDLHDPAGRNHQEHPHHDEQRHLRSRPVRRARAVRRGQGRPLARGL